MSIKVGDHVRHPSRGQGTVSTIVYSPLNKRPFKAWVEFPFMGTATRKYVCFAEDLVIVPKPPTSTERPVLRAVEPANVVA